MYAVLIGSRALKKYFPIGREPKDTDILCDSEWFKQHVKVEVPRKFRYIEEGYEFFIADEKSPYLSDMQLLKYCAPLTSYIYRDARFSLFVAAASVLKVLKLSCYKHLNKPKHAEDLKLLENVSLSPQLLEILALREKEVIIRQQVMKDKFFNKYAVARVIDHEELHKIVSPSPAYLKVVEDAVIPNKDRFDALPLTDKVKIAQEEIAVLMIERSVLGSIVNQPYNSKRAKRQAAKLESNQIFEYWLNRFCSNLKDHPVWLAAWADENREHIREGFLPWFASILESDAITDLIKKAISVGLEQMRHKLTQDVKNEQNV